MHRPHGPMKRSGDVHPPELEDGIVELDPHRATHATPASSSIAIIEPIELPVRRTRPSLMPLLGLVLGGFALYRLIR